MQAKTTDLFLYDNAANSLTSIVTVVDGKTNKACIRKNIEYQQENKAYIEALTSKLVQYLVGDQSLSSTNYIKKEGETKVVYSEIANYQPYMKIDNNFKFNQEELMALITANYIVQENDAHIGNFGINGLTNKAFAIDRDQAFWAISCEEAGFDNNKTRNDYPELIEEFTQRHFPENVYIGKEQFGIAAHDLDNLCLPMEKRQKDRSKYFPFNAIQDNYLCVDFDTDPLTRAKKLEVFIRFILMPNTVLESCFPEGMPNKLKTGLETLIVQRKKEIFNEILNTELIKDLTHESLNKIVNDIDSYLTINSLEDDGDHIIEEEIYEEEEKISEDDQFLDQCIKIFAFSRDLSTGKKDLKSKAEDFFKMLKPKQKQEIAVSDNKLLRHGINKRLHSFAYSLRIQTQKAQNAQRQISGTVTKPLNTEDIEKLLANFIETINSDIDNIENLVEVSTNRYAKRTGQADLNKHSFIVDLSESTTKLNTNLTVFKKNLENNPQMPDAYNINEHDKFITEFGIYNQKIKNKFEEMNKLQIAIKKDLSKIHNNVEAIKKSSKIGTDENKKIKSGAFKSILGQKTTWETKFVPVVEKFGIEVQKFKRQLEDISASIDQMKSDHNITVLAQVNEKINHHQQATDNLKLVQETTKSLTEVTPNKISSMSKKAVEDQLETLKTIIGSLSPEIKKIEIPQQIPAFRGPSLLTQTAPTSDFKFGKKLCQPIIENQELYKSTEVNQELYKLTEAKKTCSRVAQNLSTQLKLRLASFQKLDELVVKIKTLKINVEQIKIYDEINQESSASQILVQMNRYSNDLQCLEEIYQALERDFTSEFLSDSKYSGIRRSLTGLKAALGTKMTSSPSPYPKVQEVKEQFHSAGNQNLFYSTDLNKAQNNITQLMRESMQRSSNNSVTAVNKNITPFDILIRNLENEISRRKCVILKQLKKDILEILRTKYIENGRSIDQEDVTGAIREYKGSDKKTSEADIRHSLRSGVFSHRTRDLIDRVINESAVKNNIFFDQKVR